MKKLVIIGSDYNSIKNFRFGLITSIIKDGVKVFVLGLDLADHEKQELRSLGAIPVAYQGSKRSINMFFELVSLFRLYRQVRKIKPDTLFAYFGKQIVIGGFLSALIRPRRSVALFEGLGYGFGESKLPVRKSAHRWLVKMVQVASYNLSLGFYDKVVFLNRDDPRDLGKYLLVKMDIECLGPIGVDLEKMTPRPMPPLVPVVFVFVGRLILEKGISEFVKAAYLVSKETSDVKFVVLGSTDPKNPLPLEVGNLFRKAEKDIRIEFKGYVPDPVEFLANSHVLVLPSFYREGFPRCIQEAMAIGRPVITTDSVGCRDSVVHEFDGFLVPTKSTISVARRMLDLIKSPRMLRSMGENASESARAKYDEKRFNNRLKELMEIND